MRQLQRRRGRWLIRGQDLELCPHPMSGPHRPGEGIRGHVCLPHLLLVPAQWQMVVCPCPFPAAPSPKSIQRKVLPAHAVPGESPVAPSGSRFFENKGHKEG